MKLTKPQQQGLMALLRCHQPGIVVGHKLIALGLSTSTRVTPDWTSVWTLARDRFELTPAGEEIAQQLADAAAAALQAERLAEGMVLVPRWAVHFLARRPEQGAPGPWADAQQMLLDALAADRVPGG